MQRLVAPRFDEDRFNLEVLKLRREDAAGDGHVDSCAVERIEGVGRR